MNVLKENNWFKMQYLLFSRVNVAYSERSGSVSCWHTFYQLCGRKEFFAIHNYCLPEILNEKLIIFITLNIGVDF